MASFRGIGDAATPVKMQQDQMAQQAALEANRLNQQANQFEETMDVQKENTAWNRSQTEAAKEEDKRRFELGQQKDQARMAEDTRRFNIGDQRASRGELAGLRAETRAEKQLTMEEFRNRLAANRELRDATKDDVQTRLANAQLEQYIAAADDEKKQRSNRERMSKGAFGGLLIAGEINGGVLPTTALVAANKDLGDKENQITGGFKDPNTGVWVFEMTNLPTKQVKQLKMAPENQYVAIHDGLGKPHADAFMELYKADSLQRKAMERRRIEMEDAVGLDAVKYANRKQMDAEDPMKRVEAYQKQAEALRKRAATPEVMIDENLKTKYLQEAEAFENEAGNLLRPKKQAQPKPFALTPEMATKNGIPPSGTRSFPNPKGGYSVTWRENGKVKQADFAEGEY